LLREEIPVEGGIQQMKKAIVTMGCAALFGASLIGCTPLSSSHHSANWTAPAATTVPSDAAAPVSQSPYTPGQERAIDKAMSYLDYSAFSKSGLVKQLQYEHFDPADATFAVEQLETSGRVDWNEQAVRKAQSYLGYSSFSLDGLAQQLEYEGFTPSEAQHGATTAYGA
jgi:hypothetical protein